MIENYKEKVFEDIKHIDENGVEFWYARELMSVLDYSKWSNFEKVIDKAKISCELSNNIVSDWFAEVGKPIITGKGKKEIIEDYKLSRYSCYLIVQNADPRKDAVALGQTYFAVQTRKQELLEKEYSDLSELDKRILNRELTKKGNLKLNETAKDAGVKNFGEFHNAGYRGLYNGETADDIFKRKGLKYREEILDNMGSEELIDNLFRIVQTESKLKNDKIDSEMDANETHYIVGKKVRDTIKELGGTMPENLPTPSKSLKQIKEDSKKLNK